MKGIIEKNFDNLKNQLDMKRVRPHSKETSEGKLFVSFLGLILRAQLENTLRDYLRKNSLPLEKALKELRKVKAVESKEGRCLLNPLSKTQKDILSYFGKTETDIHNRLQNL